MAGTQEEGDLERRLRVKVGVGDTLGAWGALEGFCARGADMTDALKKIFIFQMNLWLPEEGIVREFGMDRYTLLLLKWINNKDLLCSTGNAAQCSVPAWMGGESGGEWIHAYVRLSPFTVHLKLSHLC